MVAGMTGSGKTVWVKSLLQQAQKVIHLPPERVVLVLLAMAARVHGIAGNHTKHLSRVFHLT